VANSIGITNEMTTKNDFLDFLRINLAKSANWRRLQALRWPDDARNERAAQRLFLLASQATDINDDAWDHVGPYFDPNDRRWHEAVSSASRDVGFRTSPHDFNSYVQNVIDTLMVSA
jgi:hypothetical protein